MNFRTFSRDSALGSNVKFLIGIKFFFIKCDFIAFKFHLTLPVIDHTVIITGFFMPLRQYRRQ